MLGHQRFQSALSLHRRNLHWRSEDIKGVDCFGARLNLPYFARLYWAAMQIGEMFVKDPVFNEDSICVAGAFDEEAGVWMGLGEFSLDLKVKELPSTDKSYKKDNPGYNARTQLIKHLSHFGCKVTRTDKDGKVLSVQPHHESHVYYVRHTAFVPGNWDTVKDLVITTNGSGSKERSY